MEFIDTIKEIYAFIEPALTFLGWVFWCVLGTTSHFLKELKKVSKTDPAINWQTYWTHNKFQSMTSIIGAIVLFELAIEIETMNNMMAFGCGYMANSGADMVGQRASKLGQ